MCHLQNKVDVEIKLDMYTKQGSAGNICNIFFFTCFGEI